MAAWLLYCVVSRELYYTVLCTAPVLRGQQGTVLHCTVYCTCTAWSAGSPPPGSWPPPAPAETRPDPWGNEKIRTLTDTTPILPLSHPPVRGLLAGHHGRQLQVVPRQHQPTRPDQSQVGIWYWSYFGPIRGEYCGQLTNHSSPEHGHGLLELRGLDRAREVGQGHLLPLLASGQELLHLDNRNCRL